MMKAKSNILIAFISLIAAGFLIWAAEHVATADNRIGFEQTIVNLEKIAVVVLICSFLIGEFSKISEYIIGLINGNRDRHPLGLRFKHVFILMTTLFISVLIVIAGILWYRML